MYPKQNNTQEQYDHMKGNNQGLIYLNNIYNMHWFKSVKKEVVVKATNHV